MDWVSTLTLEGGALLEARAVKLPVWDEGVASRTCSAEAIVRRSGARRLLASDAELSIDVWDDHAVYGRVKVNGGELSFSAPFVPSVVADETTCCLKIRPQFPLPGPSLSAEEAKAVCAARDATPPMRARSGGPNSPRS